MTRRASRILNREVGHGPRRMRNPYVEGDAPDTVPGETLTMADGSVWFHAYGGGSPVPLRWNRDSEPYRAWSPKTLAAALGYRLELRDAKAGQRSAWLLGPTGRAHPTGYDHAHRVLGRLARWRGLSPEVSR